MFEQFINCLKHEVGEQHSNQTSLAAGSIDKDSSDFGDVTKKGVT